MAAAALPVAITAITALRLIRMAAADLAMAPWQRPRDADLVQLGLDALMTDIEAPSLPLLAGLARGEYPQARELFDLVLEELDLLPPTSDDLAKARWTAAQWWAGQIVTCQLDPVHGAKLIYEEAAAELDYPTRCNPSLIWRERPTCRTINLRPSSTSATGSPPRRETFSPHKSTRTRTRDWAVDAGQARRGQPRCSA
ncbi:hypothetical protein GCM10010103_55170 [Streptomyces paradoxus]|uniref:Uncharacterized protein n=1 Tax=Streptomyces paradoxus TaxID=66375 RepID=A0A7W9TG52_9ACTN|nr:hypothetical protein [Streptomyces paradoxus]MBB6079471.1 hypothetical protein [Streptomyces paradoxus]